MPAFDQGRYLVSPATTGLLPKKPSAKLNRAPALFFSYYNQNRLIIGNKCKQEFLTNKH